MVIAIDAMGGDLFPVNPVLGALKAVNENGISVVLVGDETAVKKELDRHRYNTHKVELVHAPQTVEMDESVSSVLRKKKNSSMWYCYEMHKKGDVQGVVSAGNSGAMLAIGRFVMKMIPYVRRPCISAILPSMKGNVLLVDAGANTDCSAKQLTQFAVLGHVYMKNFFSVSSPRIGLLNVGSEAGKGDEVRKETYHILKESSLNFMGNIEGEDFFNGDIDVVVTDGFAGNILLKSVQAAASFLKKTLKQETQKSLLTQAGAFLLKSSLERLQKKTDYAEFGGAPLLGLSGNSVICHGKSNPDAIQFGIGFAQWAADIQMVMQMEEKMGEFEKILTLGIV